MDNYIQEYEEDVLKYIEDEKENRFYDNILIVCLENDAYYYNFKMAQDCTGINAHDIARACRDGGAAGYDNDRVGFAGGHHWMFVFEDEYWSHHKEEN